MPGEMQNDDVVWRSKWLDGKVLRLLHSRLLRFLLLSQVLWPVVIFFISLLRCFLLLHRCRLGVGIIELNKEGCMRTIGSDEIVFVDGGKCGPMSAGDKIEAGIVFIATGPIGLSIWYRAYTNACA